MIRSKIHTLIVDDDDDIRRSLSHYLERNGLRCSTSVNGKEMDAKLAKYNINLIILDIMLAGEDGLAICARLQQSSRIPIILLTALAEDTDRVVGLELGADDYITKPFNPRELLARIKSVMRRSEMLPPKMFNSRRVVKFDRWRFDFTQREVIGPQNVVVRLSSGEHILLISLIEHAGITLSREQLLDLTKGRDAQLFDRSIDNQISRLRRKLELNPKTPKIILTDWGGGYVFAAEASPHE